MDTEKAMGIALAEPGKRPRRPGRMSFGIRACGLAGQIGGTLAPARLRTARPGLVHDALTAGAITSDGSEGA